MIAIATPQKQQKETEVAQKLTFEQFLKIYPEYGHYELIDGELVEIFEMAFTRNHDDVREFIDRRFYREVERLALNYVIKRAVPIRSIDQNGNECGRVPDLSVIDATSWRSNRSDYKGFRDKIQLAVEVVSTNWEDDYIDKFEEYQRLGITEYWIVDYLAIGSRNYLGEPKLPSVLIFTLDAEGKYQITRFQNSDRLISATFPELNLAVEQIMAA